MPGNGWRSIDGLRRRPLAYLLPVAALMASGAVAGALLSRSAPSEPASAVASSGTVLEGLEDISSVVADVSHGRVFVVGSGTAVALGLNGGIIQRLDVEGASTAAITGEHLYLGTRRAVVEVDLGTLEVGRRFSVGTTPVGLAVSGGRVWFSHSGGLSGLDPATGDIVTAGGGASAVLRAGPAQPGLLLAWTADRLDLLDGASGEVVAGGATEGVVDAVVASDGDAVLAAVPSSGGLVELAADGLAPTGFVYPTGPGPVAVDVSPEAGGLVAAGTENGVGVFRPGRPEAIMAVDLPGAVTPGGVAIAPDGETVLAVTGGPDGPTVHVRPITTATPAPAGAAGPEAVAAPAPIGAAPPEAGATTPGPAEAAPPQAGATPPAGPATQVAAAVTPPPAVEAPPVTAAPVTTPPAAEAPPPPAVTPPPAVEAPPPPADGNPTPGLGVSPSALDFGAIGVGDMSAPRALTLTNTGSQTLTFGSPFDASAFDLDRDDFAVAWSTCDTSQHGLEPGQGCQVAFQFAPTRSGGRTAALVVYSDAVDSPRRLRLTGSGSP